MVGFFCGQQPREDKVTWNGHEKRHEKRCLHHNRLDCRLEWFAWLIFQKFDLLCLKNDCLFSTVFGVLVMTFFFDNVHFSQNSGSVMSGCFDEICLYLIVR